MELGKLIEEIQSYGLDFDHAGHQVLLNAANSIKGIDGIVCEIGLRRGGGLLLMMLSCVNNEDKDRQFIAIDPYGNIPYHFMNGYTTRLDYTNSMKNETLSSLYSICSKFNLNFNMYTLTDVDFFNKFSDGVCVYNENKFLVNEYALVHLDGPHTNEDLLVEINFFKERMSIGGFIVLDDVKGFFDLDKLEESLLEGENFILVENDGRKASYKRVK